MAAGGSIDHRKGKGSTKETVRRLPPWPRSETVVVTMGGIFRETRGSFV